MSEFSKERQCSRFPCPYCSETTPYANCYKTCSGDYWCPTGHHYLDTAEVES